LRAMGLLLLFIFCIVGCCAQNYPNIFTLVPPSVGLTVNIKSGELGLPVVIYHYTQNQTGWWNGQNYIIPDEMFFFSSKKWVMSEGGIINSVDEYFQNYVAQTPYYKSAYVGGEPLTSAFNSSWLIDLFNHTQNFGVLLGEMIEFNMELYPGFDTEDWFNEVTQLLPTSYSNETCHKFWDFFDLFGTHYLSNTVYGGKFRFQLNFNTSIYDNQSISWVTQQLALSWKHIEMDYKFPGVNVSQPVDPLFRKVVTSTLLDVSGGVPFGLGLSAWLKSLVNKPGYLLDVTTVSPLYSLVQSNSLHAAMRQATIDYGNGLFCR